VAGVLDLTAAANDPLLELKTVIDSYADYSAEIFYGDDDIDTGNILDAEVQAKDIWSYLLFSIDSVLDTENALISWEYAKAMLELDDDQQTKIERLINSASRSANQYTQRMLKARDYDVTLDAYGGKTLKLPEAPVNELTSVHVDTERNFGAETEVTSDILLYDKGGTIAYSTGFPDELQCVKVVYNAGYGYGVEAVPEDIQIAILETVQWYRARLSGEGIGVTAIQNPNGITTRFEADLPVSARRRLEYYMRVAL
jgi:uncharacterized phiE125 gp8 family phage protein